MQEIRSIRGKNTVASHIIPSSLFSEVVRYTVTYIPNPSLPLPPSAATVTPSVGGTVSPSSSVSSESAQPVWDAPSGAAADDAFGLLSQQTESFARSAAGLPTRSSFASIVSGGWRRCG